MDIPDKRQQIRVLLAENGLVAALKQVPVSSMAPVERHRIAGQQPLHDARNGDIARSEQQVKVVGDQCPGKTCCLGIFDNGPQMGQKVIPVP